MESINAINEILISAYSLWHSVIDNCIEIFSLQLSRVVISTHYERVCFYRVWWNELSETCPCLGDEAARASCGRPEPPTVQPCGTEHSLAAKSRVFVRKLTSAIVKFQYVD